MSSSREATKFLALFAAEEIPAAIVTYVALLMLLQLELAPAVATLCSALLFVPWMLKSFMRPWLSRVGNLRLLLFVVEALLFVSMVLLAFSFKVGPVVVFFALLLVSLLCAWHELVARMYYERTLSPSCQRLLTVPKHICSQAAVIFTYGALIFLVGTLEVYFRQIRYSWSVGCYVVAGLFLLLSLLHLISYQGMKSEEFLDSLEPRCDCSRGRRVKNINNQLGKQGNESNTDSSPFTFHSSVFTLFLLLLPQALMFHARVLYLFDSQTQGGLQCTIQEIGFAQGTVGVIAFSIGLFLGRRLIHSSRFHIFTFSLFLSPFVYLGMTFWPPQSLETLCCCTLTAQLLFGLGLGICRLPISAISGTRYRNTINMLQIPLVSAAMIVPMALSGWLVEQLGYHIYFLVNVLTVPVCLLGIYLLNRREFPRMF